jgi:hypothetical protein
MATQAPSPALNVQALCAEVHAEIQSLFIRDAAWTQLPAQNVPASTADREALAGLAETIDAQLARLTELLPRLQKALADHGPWLEEQATVLKNNSIGGARVRALIAKKDVPLAKNVNDAFANIDRRIAAERADLQAKIAPLRGTGPVDTDISSSTWCALAAVDGAALIGLGPVGWGFAATLAQDAADHGCF